MKKKNVRCLIAFLICFCMIGSMYPVFADSQEALKLDNLQSTPTTESLIETFQKYTTDQKAISSIQTKSIDLPWMDTQSQILEWFINIQYDGQTFRKQIPLDIFDFSEKFLKHPEYGERIKFNIDDDPEDDIEIIAGFYWSVVNKPDGNEIKSLEKRLRMVQLQTGDYIENSEASFEIWSELHINYGIFKNKAKIQEPRTLLLSMMRQVITTQLDQQHHPLIYRFFDQLFNRFSVDSTLPLFDDDDYILVGSGYRSQDGDEIPRYMDKRFAFAREELFSPSIFQHQIDPASSQGKDTLELLYGFQSYRGGSSNPTYDIEFSVTFQPAVYLKTKFIPLGGHVYYFFDDQSRQSSQTSISFTSNILNGPSSDEGIDLTLLFNDIDDTLASTGNWFKFDLDVLHDFDLFGGKLSYEASDIFDIDLIADSPFFEEKVKFKTIPKRVDLSWDLDFQIMPTFANLFAHAKGFIDVDMSSDFGGIYVYYPKTDPQAEDMIFMDVSEGIPQTSRIDAETSVNMDLTNLLDSGNYISGKIEHDCSSNIKSVQVFLPETALPIVKVTEIPAQSRAQAQLHMNPLRGNAHVLRGSTGPPDPIEVNLEFMGFRIHDTLTIRDGHIDTSFAIAENGHFFFDTSDGMFGNDLTASSVETGDEITLVVEEVSANDFHADWDLDTSGEQLKINDFSFNGMVDTLKNMQLDLNYMGKTTNVNVDWLLRKTGSFFIQVDQEDDLSLDFSQFAQNSSDFDLDGGISISDVISLDFDWKFQQGVNNGYNVDPGRFTINALNNQATIKDFDLYFTYQDRYGVDISFENLQFYLDFEWWRGERLLPYIWLDYLVSADDFDVDLLWTNMNGESRWYRNVEDGIQ